MSNKPNIVQAEFFYVGGPETKTLEQLAADIYERVLTNLPLALAGIEASNGIKEAVRFYDEKGLLTSFVQKAQYYDERYTETLEALGNSKPGSFRRWILKQFLHFYARSKDQQQRWATRLALREFGEVLYRNQDVAVERVDRSFRPMQKDEQHELWERSMRAKNLWLFVFEPNDLCTDSNRLVAAMTF